MLDPVLRPVWGRLSRLLAVRADGRFGRENQHHRNVNDDSCACGQAPHCSPRSSPAVPCDWKHAVEEGSTVAR